MEYYSLLGGGYCFSVQAQTVAQKPKISFALKNSTLTWKASGATKCTAGTDYYSDIKKSWMKETKDRQWIGSKRLKGSKKIKEPSLKKFRYKLTCTKTVKKGKPLTSEAIVMNPKKWPSDQYVKLFPSIQKKK